MSVEKVNPANAGERISERKRIPMSLPRQRLSVREIPGYHMYWMRGTSERISQALNAGYEFVSPDEVNLTNSALAGSATLSGNSDLGSRVSVIAGGEIDADGQPVRLYLMKLAQEYYEADQAIQARQNDALIETLQAGSIGGERGDSRDRGSRYVQSSSNLFNPKSIRR
jgi:hypothetical protein